MSMNGSTSLVTVCLALVALSLTSVATQEQAAGVPRGVIALPNENSKAVVSASQTPPTFSASLRLRSGQRRCSTWK